MICSQMLSSPLCMENTSEISCWFWKILYFVCLLAFLNLPSKWGGKGEKWLGMVLFNFETVSRLVQRSKLREGRKQAGVEEVALRGKETGSCRGSMKSGATYNCVFTLCVPSHVTLGIWPSEDEISHPKTWIITASEGGSRQCWFYSS